MINKGRGRHRVLQLKRPEFYNEAPKTSMIGRRRPFHFPTKRTAQDSENLHTT